MENHHHVPQRAEQHRGRRYPRLAAWAVGAALPCGWLATGLDPFSTRATIVVLAMGTSAIVIGRATFAVASSAQRASTAPWLVLGAALAVWELAAYVQHPRADHPTLSSLLNAALEGRPARSLAFAAWLLVATWLSRR